jgi:hypothetical protein
MTEKRFTIAGVVFNDQAPSPKPQKKKAVKAKSAPVVAEVVKPAEDNTTENQVSEDA